MSKRAQPAWETAAILLAIVAIWPALLKWQMPDFFVPKWLAWGLLLAALAVMVGVFVRRVRRLRRLVDGEPDEPPGGPFPGAPPGQGPPS